MKPIDNARNFLSRLHHDERGEIPVGTILVIALIVIPLVVLLVAFRDKVGEFLATMWQEISGADKKSAGTF